MQKMAIKAFNDTDLDVNFLTLFCEDLEIEDNSIDTIVRHMFFAQFWI